MRIDSHQHFWDLSRLHYSWMPPEPSPLRRNYLPEDLKPILERNNFDGSIVVQAATAMTETEWLLQLASENDEIPGVVAWVDLTERRCGDVLDRLQRNPKFCGVRHPVHDEADAGWLLRPDVIPGLRELERRRIPFDLLVRPQHLPVVRQLVDQVPSLPMVIDHIAKPPIASGAFEPWAGDISQLAGVPHLYVKISGMITEADHKQWTSRQLIPYVQHVWTTFGPERCMFGSDWPVCHLAGTWKDVLAAFTQALGPVDKEVRAGVMGENAARFYALS